MIKIYTTNTCPWCVKVKNYLKKKNIEFTELNVQDNPTLREEVISKSGQTNLPMLDMSGNIIIGFDRESIDKCIKELT